MIIDILKAKKSNEPQAFSGSGVLADNVLLRDNSRFIKPITVEGTFQHFEDEVLFSGVVRFDLKTSCDRCGKDIEKSFEFALKERFVKNCADAEVYSYDSDRVDLALAVSECIMINLPTQIICKDKCKGLCEICGANLNDAKCKCKKENNSAFSALKDIKK